jgi:hypothetical protein
MLKIAEKFILAGRHVNIIKAMYNKKTSNLTLKVEKLFTPMSGTRQK